MTFASPESTRVHAGATSTPSSAVTPALSNAQAAALLRAHWGLTAEVECLTSERDLNLRLSLADGRVAVMKVANPDEPVADTQRQTDVLRLLEARADLPVQRVFPSCDGRTLIRVTLDDGRDASVRVLSYLAGRLQHQTRPALTQARALGATLGRLDQALAQLPAEDSPTGILWDLQAFDRLVPLLPQVEDVVLRAQCERVIGRAATLPSLHGAGLNRQLIHNDLNPHNVLIGDDGEAVAGLLDFGDMLVAPRVADLAVAASYQLGLEVKTDLARWEAMVEACDAVLDYSDQERTLLMPLSAMRLAMTVLITEWRARLHPENRGYILRNNPRARAGLALLAAQGLLS